MSQRPAEDPPRAPGAGAGLLLAASLAAAAVLLWFVFRPQIVAGVLAVQGGLASFAAPFSEPQEAILWQLSGTDPNDPSITPFRLWRLASRVGGFYAVPAAALLLALAFLCWRGVEGKAGYRRKLDLAGLMREQARTHGTTAPFAARHVRPVEPRPGAPRPLDPALHLKEWAARYATGPDGLFCSNSALRHLSAQLGPLWDGPAVAPPHVRCLFAAFALHAARERDEALAFLQDLARSLPREPDEGTGGPLLPLSLPARVVEDADAILRDPHLTRPCAAVAARHAYTATALMSVLCRARERAGVLNPGLFAWVQLVDRSLYFALDAAPFPTPGVRWHLGPSHPPLAEGMGAHDHWRHEAEAGAPLVLPTVPGAHACVRAAFGHTPGT